MQNRYGISLTRDVTEIFVQRLLGMKLLCRSIESKDPVWVRQKEGEEKETENAGRLDDVIDAATTLHAERSDLLKSPFSEDSFLGALMSVMLNQNMGLRNAVKAIKTINEPSAPSAEHTQQALGPDEYFASEFITWAAEHQKDIFDWLADLGGTAFVAEALIEIRTPRANQNIKTNVTIYLDAPFLMELLGCSGQAARDDAKFIVDTLQSQRIPVAVLSHSIKELCGNLRGVLKATSHRRTGPTAKALLYREVTEDYLESVLHDPKYFVVKLNIKIIDPEKLSHLIYENVFTDKDEQNFYAAIYGIYDHELAREKDVASIAWIMRRRNAETSRDVLRSKHILLTRNTLLVRYAKKFAVENCGYPKNAAGPAILARELAGILWLIVGQIERHELSKRQLVLSCERARSAAPQVVSAMYDAVQNINPKNAELLWAAMQKPTYLSMAMDAVSSSSGQVNLAAAEATIEKIREDLIREERAHSADNLERKKEKFDTENALQKIINSNLEKERISLINKNKEFIDNLRSNSQRLWNNNEKLGRCFFLVSRISMNAILIVVAVGMAVYGTDFFTATWQWKAVVSALATLFLLYFGNRKFSNILREKISIFFTNRYKRQICNIAGNYTNSVLITSPILISMVQNQAAEQ